MKFIALNVNAGDSFYLKDDTNEFVVDGGKNKLHIRERLEQITSDINVLICTHYDKDHFNGIVGIVNSKKFKIDELWLPAVFGNIALTINKDIGIVKQLKGYFEEKFDSNNTGKNENWDKIEIENKNENIDTEYNGKCPNVDTLFDFNNAEQMKKDFNQLFMKIGKKKTRIVCQLKIIREINEMILALRNTETCIRWLKYIDCLCDTKISSRYNLLGLNSHMTSCVKYNFPQLINALQCLTSGNMENPNERSLVFKYEDKSNPNILFTADSNFVFLKKSYYPLNDNSIVTAPHHGSKWNQSVYALILGKDLIYVRSDNFQKVRPCSTYINLPTKYCTKCRDNRLTGQQIILDYCNVKKTWIPVSRTAECKSNSNYKSCY
jgi:beta-lactamase superfamily II metal-dependent hydrolase